MPQVRSIISGWLFLFGGLVIGGIGLLVGFFEFLAIVDPVGTKMSDDADPFGDPYISPLEHFFFIAITVGLLSLSVRLFFHASKRLELANADRGST